MAAFVTGIETAVAAGALADTSGDLARLIGRPSTPLRATLATG